MKKTLIFLAMLAVSCAALADSYMTMGENDTLRVPRTALGSYYHASIRAHFDGRLDTWYLTMTCPSGLTIADVHEGADMTLTYTGKNGTPATYTAVLGYSDVENGVNLSTMSVAQGYWDYNYDGVYECYGTVKWGPGDYSDMVSFLFSVDPGFGGGVISFNGYLNTTNDTRGGTQYYPCFFQRTVTVIVERLVGDIDNDGELSISDITLLISLVLSGEGTLLEGQELYAADVNGDGTVDITDVTLLINKVLTGAW